MGREDGGPPVRVAILGGGCAGISAAWQLSRQDNYQIDLYEKSWRLGGKGASVRAQDGRILEHGLHVWLGFYENAFRMMRECYKEVQAQKWGPNAESPNGKLVHGCIDDAFYPEPHIGVGYPSPKDGQAIQGIWSGLVPPAKGLPGTDLDESTNPFTLASYLLRCFDLLKMLILSVIGPAKDDVPGEPRPDGRSIADEILDLQFSPDTATSAQLLIDRMTRMLRAGSLAGAAALLQAVTILENWIQNLDFQPQVADSAIELIKTVAALTRKSLREIASIDPQIRMKTELIDIVLTIAVGLFQDRVLFDDKGLDSINQFDYRDWLLRHGATKTSVESRFLSGIYDFTFAYRDGDKNKPQLAAGVAVRTALRMFFTYRGSMFWRIRSGMGDAVFAPLYKVLLLSGRKPNVNSSNQQKVTGSESHDVPAVRFHFLHEVKEVCLDVTSNGKKYVKSLYFETSGDPGSLDELSAKALDDTGCWPDSPNHCFGNALKSQKSGRTLTLGNDFDRVIFATGIDDFKSIFDHAMWKPGQSASEIPPSKLPPVWTKMCYEVKTVATKSAQVWLEQDVESLGWYRGPGLFTALYHSFDTWGDMTHVLAAERAWRAGNKASESSLDRASSLAYFCEALPQAQIEICAEILKTIDGLRVIVRRRRPLFQRLIQRSASARQRAKVAIGKIKDRLRAAKLSDLQDLIGNDLDALSSLIARLDASSLPELERRLAHVMEIIERTPLQELLERQAGADLTRMLHEDMRAIWPEPFKSGSKPTELSRHVMVNFEGSDRYTQSLPGSLAFRISPLRRDVENMTIAGDWTACGLDAGCVETAVMSGMLAAHAVSGKPNLESIIGYDHP